METILIALGLGADAMSISAAIGVKWHGPRQKFRLAWHMGLFQFMMPLIGYVVGQGLAELISSYGKYIAGGLVFLIGLKMFIEVIKSGRKDKNQTADQPAEPAAAGKAGGDPTLGWSLIVLSVATSLDALVIGVSLGVRPDPAEHPIGFSSVIIGLTAGVMSLTGVFLGQHIGKALGRYAELAGALVLMGLGVSFVWF
ncbi:MAG: manganese efflux pump [Planctomycetes bacterium]|nr:manganese efflux pump [Planctomycetota bacterium]